MAEFRSGAYVTATYRNRTSQGVAWLGVTELEFQGDFRVKVRLDYITRLFNRKKVMYVEWTGGKAQLQFETRVRAEKWIEMIREPKGWWDRLRIRDKSKALFIHLHDDDLWNALWDHGCEVGVNEYDKDRDNVFLCVYDKRDLEYVAPLLRKSLKKNGALWLVRPRYGRLRVNDKQLRAAAEREGLTYLVTVPISREHSGLKFIRWPSAPAR